MKTIWLINPYGPIEGENWREYSFNQFGKYLSKNGYKVIWWTSSFSHHFKKQRASGWKDVIVDENFTIRLVPTTAYKKNFGFGRLFKDFVFGKNAYKRFKTEVTPDLIISAENPITMGYPSYTYAKKHNVPMIYDQMDIWPEFIVKSTNHMMAKILNVCFVPVYKRRKTIYDFLSGSIALGKHYLEFMFDVSHGLKEKPNALVYNGIDVNEFRSHLQDSIDVKNVPDKKSEEIWCVFAGTLGPSYDIKGILECAKMLKEHGLDQYKFIIAGSGPYEELVFEYEKLLDNVIYVGKLLPSQLIPIYGKCDIGLSTYSKGSNVDMCDKFYDYTAAGLAVINSLKGEVSEHIKNNQLGINYDANNRASLYEAFIELSNPSILEIAKANSIKVGMEFDKNKQNEKLLSVIHNIIENK